MVSNRLPVPSVSLCSNLKLQILVFRFRENTKHKLKTKLASIFDTKYFSAKTKEALIIFVVVISQQAKA